MLRLSHYPNANADVESSHRLIGDEFYSRESFSSIKDFLVKAPSYQLYFNFLRKNSYEKIKIFSSIAFMPPLIVDKLLSKNSLTIPLNLNYGLYLHVPKLPDLRLMG